MEGHPKPLSFPTATNRRAAAIRHTSPISSFASRLIPAGLDLHPSTLDVDLTIIILPFLLLSDSIVVGAHWHRIPAANLDLQPEHQALLREAVFPDWKDDASGAGLDNVDEMRRKDPLQVQIWKLYSRTKGQLPNSERMENLTWRMMAMNLRRKERESASRCVCDSRRLPSIVLQCMHKRACRDPIVTILHVECRTNRWCTSDTRRITTLLLAGQPLRPRARPALHSCGNPAR